MEWARLASTDIESINRNIPVILPVTALEQHGPHLPVSTDQLIGEYFCRELDRRIPDRALILPAVVITNSRHHMGFPGTLTVTHATFIRYVSEILEAVIANGFSTIVMFNSHGGNQAAAQVILEDMGVSHPGCRVALLTWWKVAHEQLMAISETGPGGVGHACEFETSLLQLIAPELVHTDRIAPGKNRPTYAWAESDMMRGSSGLLHRSIQEMTPNGVFGDPTAATREKGARIAAVVVEALERIVNDLGES